MTGFYDGPHPRALAHRGWHIGDLADAENTMAAFRRAVAEGYRYLETDVQVTADGELVVLHDPILDRVADRPGTVGALSLAQVREARIAGRHRIPTFAELLEFLVEHPLVAVNVDCKSFAAVGPLAAALRTSGVGARVTVAAFSDRRLRLLADRLGRQVHWSTGPRGIARLALGLPPTADGPTPAAAQVPPRFRRLTVVTPGFVRRAHDRGIEVHVWTIDDPGAMHRLLDLGVDGLITDRPDVLRAALRERGQWPDLGSPVEPGPDR